MYDYEINVNIKMAIIISADNKGKAIQMVKEDFKQDYNLDLTDEEIKSVEKI